MPPCCMHFKNSIKTQKRVLWRVYKPPWTNVFPFTCFAKVSKPEEVDLKSTFQLLRPPQQKISNFSYISPMARYNDVTKSNRSQDVLIFSSHPQRSLFWICKLWNIAGRDSITTGFNITNATIALIKLNHSTSLHWSACIHNFLSRSPYQTFYSFRKIKNQEVFSQAVVHLETSC